MAFKAEVLLLLSTPLFAAEFQSGQAARAVFGQSSFTSRESGIKVISMVVLRDRLYAAEASHHILAFDLARLGDVHDDRAGRWSNGCPACGMAPAGQTNQSVMPGVAAVSVWEKTVAVADAKNRRVLLWRDSTAARASRGPDVTLGLAGEAAAGPRTLVDPISVAVDGKRLFVGDAALHRVLVWSSLPASDDQPADVVLGQPDFVSTSGSDTSGPDSIAVPTAMVSDGNNLYVADFISRRILVFSPGDAVLAPDSVVNSASLVSGPVAPGTLITVSGSSFGDITDAATTNAGELLPRRLGGVEAVFDGQAVPLLTVSPTQVQAQIPYELGSRNAASFYLRVEHSGGVPTVTSAIALKLVPASPGLFAVGGNEPRSGIVLHGTNPGGTNAGSRGSQPVTDENPVSPGEVVTVWATGLGAVIESGGGLNAGPGRARDGPAVAPAIPVSAQIDGQAAQVISAKLPAGAAGVYEIRIAVPAEVEAGTEAWLSVTQNGATSNSITFPIGR